MYAALLSFIRLDVLLHFHRTGDHPWQLQGSLSALLSMVALIAADSVIGFRGLEFRV